METMQKINDSCDTTQIHIYKSKRLAAVILGGHTVFSCRAGLGPCPAGPKRAEGDGRTPEGVYYVCTRNERSKYTLFLGISYPSAADAQQALASGLITQTQLTAIIEAEQAGARPPWATPLGGQIGIHGGGVPEGNGLADNTAGCIALLDDDIRRLWALAPLNTRVVIHP